MRVRCGGEGSEVWRLRLCPSEPEGSILIDEEGVDALAQILERAGASPTCRVLVLEGQPGRFCTGMDLGQEMGSGADLSSQVQRFAGCLEALRQGPQVVLAAVDGDVAGGGVGLAAAADLLLATETSSFSLPELSLGLLPAVVLPILLERMPSQRARRLCLFDSVDAGTARELGLVDQLAATPDALERGLRAAIKVALRRSPAAVAALKALQHQITGMPRAKALRLGASRTASMLQSEQTLASVRAFLDGESLPWFSRYRPGSES